MLIFFCSIFVAGEIVRRIREMTIHEASERYRIPIALLKEYESWGLCGAVKK